MSDPTSFESLVKIIQGSIPDAKARPITPDTLFSEVEGFDSMSAVNLQMDVSGAFGPNAANIPPMPEMKVGDYRQLLLNS